MLLPLRHDSATKCTHSFHIFFGLEMVSLTLLDTRTTNLDQWVLFTSGEKALTIGCFGPTTHFLGSSLQYVETAGDPSGREADELVMPET